MTKPIINKTCPGCHKTKPRTDYYPKRTTRNGISYMCRECECARHRIKTELNQPTLEQKRQLLYRRFFSKVDKTDSCWLWKAACFERGYGAFRFNGKQVKAHRFSYELHNGTIPKGMLVLHRCDIRACVNPDHLRVGTQKENIADMISKGREPNRHHAYRLTEENVIEIRHLYKQGYFQQEIAKMYGVTQSMISKVILRKRWAHIS